jgi:DNA-directed RNA polymerase specialized sigma24 family protein
MATSPAKQRAPVIDHMTVEWRSIGLSAHGTRSLRAVARRDEGLASLVLGDAKEPAACPTPFDLVEHMRRASGRIEREQAARLVRVLLREGGADPFLTRMLVQVLLPGLITVAGKLKWGRGGEWEDGDEFFGELLTTAWMVVQEWAGQDRPYAVLDLLSAIRCRVRRQLFRFKEQSRWTVPLSADAAERSAHDTTDLDELARILVDLRRDGMREEDAQVLYTHHVMGYSMAELAELTGRDRRVLYSRRDRGRRRLCA